MQKNNVLCILNVSLSLTNTVETTDKNVKIRLSEAGNSLKPA